MPTGYTAGILDGTITTFEKFAKTCMRAFGATLHMRDEPMDKEYTPAEPNDYYEKNIEVAKKRINDIQNIPDEKIIFDRRAEMEQSLKLHLERIEKKRQDKIKMDKMLTEVEQWNPPTPDHENFKMFMIEQINTTIKFDCNTLYDEAEIKQINKNLLNLNANKIREDIIEMHNSTIEHNKKQNDREIEICKTNNKWVDDLIKSLPKE